MNDTVTRFLQDHKPAILEEWRVDLKEKFAHLEEDSNLWLASQLEAFFDRIAEKLATMENAEHAGQRSETLAPELFDSLEFASRVECLVSGMRCIVRFVRDLCRESGNMTEEETDELVRELETSLRLQLHDEVQDFCRRWSEKVSLDENGNRSEGAGG